MVKAEFRKDDGCGVISLTVKGHAGAAEAGRDLVCASASILIYTAAQVAWQMYRQRRLKKRPRICLDSGDAHVVVKPKGDAFDEAIHNFSVVQVGFSLLAANYPDFVGLTSFGEAETP